MKTDVEAEALVDAPPPAKATRRRTLALLLLALVVVTLANVARIVEVQEYFQLSQDVSSASEELLVKAKPTAAEATPAPSTEATSAPTEAAPAPTEATPKRDCVKRDKSHVDPGYFNEDACFTRNETLGIIKNLVFTIADAFDAHNVTYFLDSGTLLGAFRSQGVIVHDVDADVGIDPAGLEYIRQNPIDFPSEYAFTVWSSPLYPKSDRDDKLPARLIHRASGIYVDVFAFLDWKDPKTGAAKVGPLPSWCFFNCASCPRVKSGGKQLQVDRDWIYPLVNCTFEGRTTFKCPHKTETYLRYTFGTNFMTPIAYSHR